MDPIPSSRDSTPGSRSSAQPGAGGHYSSLETHPSKRRSAHLRYKTPPREASTRLHCDDHRPTNVRLEFTNDSFASSPPADSECNDPAAASATDQHRPVADAATAAGENELEHAAQLVHVAAPHPTSATHTLRSHSSCFEAGGKSATSSPHFLRRSQSCRLPDDEDKDYHAQTYHHLTHPTSSRPLPLAAPPGSSFPVSLTTARSPPTLHIGGGGGLQPLAFNTRKPSLSPSALSTVAIQIRSKQRMRTTESWSSTTFNSNSDSPNAYYSPPNGTPLEGTFCFASSVRTGSTASPTATVSLMNRNLSYRAPQPLLSCPPESVSSPLLRPLGEVGTPLFPPTRQPSMLCFSGGPTLSSIAGANTMPARLSSSANLGFSPLMNNHTFFSSSVVALSTTKNSNDDGSQKGGGEDAETYGDGEAGTPTVRENTCIADVGLSDDQHHVADQSYVLARCDEASDNATTQTPRPRGKRLTTSDTFALPNDQLVEEDEEDDDFSTKTQPRRRSRYVTDYEHTLRYSATARPELFELARRDEEATVPHQLQFDEGNSEREREDAKSEKLTYLCDGPPKRESSFVFFDKSISSVDLMSKRVTISEPTACTHQFSQHPPQPTGVDTGDEDKETFFMAFGDSDANRTPGPSARRGNPSGRRRRRGPYHHDDHTREDAELFFSSTMPCIGGDDDDDADECDVGAVHSYGRELKPLRAALSSPVTAQPHAQHALHHVSFATPSCSYSAAQNSHNSMHFHMFAAAMKTPQTGREKQEAREFLDRELNEVNSIYRGTAPSPITDVGSGMFLGGFPGKETVDELRRLGVTHMVNCCAGQERLNAEESSGFEVLEVAAKDANDYFILYHHYDLFAKFMDKIRKDKKKVFVHCIGGVNRSVSLLAAYMIHRDQISPVEAVKRFREAGRQMILDNQTFRTELIDHFLEHCGHHIHN